MAGRLTKYRTLVEAPEFAEALNSIGDPPRIDEVLSEVFTAISVSAESFPQVLGFRAVRLAKTRGVYTADGWIPALRIWFRIVDDDHVSMMFIEAEDVPGETNDF